MDNEIQIIADDYGIMVIGDPTDVEAFLSSEGLESREVPLAASKAFNAVGAAAEAGSNIAEQSGRWVQITKESAEKIKKYGLLKSKGEYTGVIGTGGRGGIKGLIRLERTPTSLNPAMLANVGALMTQMAMQQMMSQIADYLETTDQKIDDILGSTDVCVG